MVNGDRLQSFGGGLAKLEVPENSREVDNSFLILEESFKSTMSDQAAKVHDFIMKRNTKRHNSKDRHKSRRKTTIVTGTNDTLAIDPNQQKKLQE